MASILADYSEAWQDFSFPPPPTSKAQLIASKLPTLVEFDTPPTHLQQFINPQSYKDLSQEITCMDAELKVQYPEIYLPSTLHVYYQHNDFPTGHYGSSGHMDLINKRNQMAREHNDTVTHEKELAYAMLRVWCREKKEREKERHRKKHKMTKREAKEVEKEDLWSSKEVLKVLPGIRARRVSQSTDGTQRARFELKLQQA